VTGRNEPMSERLAPLQGPEGTPPRRDDAAAVPSTGSATPDATTPNPVDPSEDAQPKGAIAVTAFLAVVILASWLGVMAVFMARR